MRSSIHHRIDRGPRGAFLLAALGLLACLPALAQPAHLVRDIDPSTPSSGVLSTTESVGVGSLFYFTFDDGVHGVEVWRSDGTPAGTFLLKDIFPGNCPSSPQSLTASGGLLYFVTSGPEAGFQLWKSDGTPEGTSLVKILYDGPGYLRFPLRDAGGKLFFLATSPSFSADLWVTDGTADGAHLVHAGFLTVPRMLAAGNGQLLFAASDGTHGLEPWVTDGTPGGTHSVADLSPGFADSLSYNAPTTGNDAVAAPWGGFVFVADDGVHGPEPWQTDASPAGAHLLRDIAPGAAGSSPYGLTAANGRVVFAATDPLHGTELWATDGTAAGPQLLKDAWPGTSGSNPLELTAVGSRVFFRAADPDHGQEPWTTDGTAAGTYLVKDLVPGPGDAFSDWGTQFAFAGVGGRLLFYSPQTASFWQSDGTVAGTLAIQPSPGFWPFPDFLYSNSWFGVAGGRLFFRAGLQGEEIWVTDGTTPGSFQVRAVPLPTSSLEVYDGYPFPGTLADFGGALFFQATDGASSSGLWRSDGTAAGTRLVKSTSSLDLLQATGSRLFFRAGGQLGVSDGTTVGTQVLSGVPVADLATLGDQALFLSQPAGGPTGLWKSDGTPAGTVLVAPHDTIWVPAWMTASGGKVFYSETSGAEGFELWTSDGTAAGSFEIDVYPGAGSSSPQYLTDVGGTLFFTATTGLDRQLWKSDGTLAGTVRVKDFAPGPGVPTQYAGRFATLPGGVLLFPADDGTHGEELWRSDGSEAGTWLVKDVHPGLHGSGIGELTTAGSQVYFAADDGVHGRELWASDGTAAGTRLVEDIVPGADSSLPTNLAAVGPALVFAAFDPDHGVEPWRSDGTALGTRRLQDIAPGPLSSSPAGFTPSGPNVYFAADDGTTGFEPWVVAKTNVLATFGDAPTDSWAWGAIEAIAAAGITTGCAPGLYCPGTPVSRAEMAVFLERALHGPGFVPPPVLALRFTDVPLDFWAAGWIDLFAAEGITTGCAPSLYCPSQAVTRAEMAVFLLRSRHGGSYVPPHVAASHFTDVPAGYWAQDWIEQLAAEGITTGCAPNLYCPGDSVGRDQMAVFLARTFHLLP